LAESFRRHLHGDPAELVAEPAPGDEESRLPRSRKTWPGWVPEGHFELLVPFRVGTSSSVPRAAWAKLNGTSRMNVLPGALEEGMILHGKVDVEVAGRTAGFASSPSPESLMVFPVSTPPGIFTDSVRSRLDALPALAGGTRVGDHPPLAAAARAGGGDAEKALLHADLAGPPAVRTGRDPVPGPGSAAVAVRAPLPAWHADLGRRAKGRVRETYGEVIPEVVAGHGRAFAPGPREELPEDVPEMSPMPIPAPNRRRSGP